MAPFSLHKWLLQSNFKERVEYMTEVQAYIPYHIDMLRRGDRETREEFRYLQRWYTVALNLSIGQIREYMEEVDLYELEGFAVPPITRPFGCDDIFDGSDSDSDISSQACEDDESDSDSESPSDDSSGNSSDPSSTDSSTTSVEEPPAPAGKLDLTLVVDSETASSWLDQHLDWHTDATDIEEADHAQQASSDVKTYDDNGFYIEENDKEKSNNVATGEPKGETDTRTDPLPSPSWADEVEDAIEEGTLPRPNSSDGESTPSSVSSEKFPDLSRCPDKSSYKPDDGSLSEELRSLLKEVGGNPEVTRPKRKTVLRSNEFCVLRSAWAKMLKAIRKEEQQRRGGQRHTETWHETDLLDSWDSKNWQFHWQTEGLFLCRLTEAVHKELFEEARCIYWMQMPKTKRSPKQKGQRKLPESPLRTQCST
ncbi:hypothetical protein F5Y10DRAFT_294555 [Nemania abortiva]|nr:hypothetical protein F5Y10DRAFT_294555 [Nemania abortiva]